MIAYEQTSLNDDGLPVVWQITKGRDATLSSFCGWLTERKQEIDTVLNKQGAWLLRGFNNMRTAEDFQCVLSTLSVSFMDYIGGTSPRDRVHGNIMTATNIPSNWSIPLHQEMSYLKHSPDRIAFFCEQAAVLGGESTLGNMRTVTQHIDPQIMAKFKKHGLQLCRTLPSLKTIHHKLGVQKAWSEVFETTDRDQINDRAMRSGWRTEWLDEDTLKIWQDILPATKYYAHDQTEVWFNQVHMFSPICSEWWAKRDGRTEDYARLQHARMYHAEKLDQMFYGNGECVAEEDAVYIAELLQASEINTSLIQSDLLILNNILVSHGRSPFSGTRKILVALIASGEKQ